MKQMHHLHSDNCHDVRSPFIEQTTEMWLDRGFHARVFHFAIMKQIFLAISLLYSFLSHLYADSSRANPAPGYLLDSVLHLAIWDHGQNC